MRKYILDKLIAFSPRPHDEIIRHCTQFGLLFGPEAAKQELANIMQEEAGKVAPRAMRASPYKSMHVDGVPFVPMDSIDYSEAKP